MSSDIVIKAENVSKQYRLGTIGSGTLSEDLARVWNRMTGKENLVHKTGERSLNNSNEILWAIKDINFEVRRGEVLGIIGKNGAGKSTLLKILSQITKPTTGEIKIKGKIASLLEVGTGFHPELTGRENVFLNGSILGMRKDEIKRKFDEIVDFSGVEKFIDTPVKRYSSGMKVRLGFAVAAHLEPEILIVDEVLAVGDAEFQKKCLGKMQDVSKNEGRTVLFVSHNLSAVRNLCSKGIVLSHGMMHYNGNADEAISSYYALLNAREIASEAVKEFGPEMNLPIQFIKASIVKDNMSPSIQFEYVEKIGLILDIQIREKRPDYTIVVLLDDAESNLILVSSYDEYGHIFLENRSPGNYQIHVRIPEKILKPGTYYLTISAKDRNGPHHKINRCFSFEVIDTQTYRGMKGLFRRTAMVAPEVHWVLH